MRGGIYVFTKRIFGALALGMLTTGAAVAQSSIIVQSTTSTANSGLYDHLLPIFQEQNDVDVRVVAVGTGQAIKNASNCDGDVLLVHARSAEEAFVAAGHGVARFDLMYNDFVIVGPRDDPADLEGIASISAALTQIAQSGALYASRGDDSGTHKKEMRLWAQTGLDPTEDSGGWYRETGSGMGATLNTGIGMAAYVMTDRATWLSFGNKSDFDILFQGDPDLFNQYGVTVVNPAHCPNVAVEAAQAFVDWLISTEGQSAIATFEREGEQLFFPNAEN